MSCIPSALGWAAIGVTSAASSSMPGDVGCSTLGEHRRRQVEHAGAGERRVTVVGLALVPASDEHHVFRTHQRRVGEAGQRRVGAAHGQGKVHAGGGAGARLLRRAEVGMPVAIGLDAAPTTAMRRWPVVPGGPC